MWDLRANLVSKEKKESREGQEKGEKKRKRKRKRREEKERKIKGMETNLEYGFCMELYGSHGFLV